LTLRYALALGVALGAATPALAASFYIVRGLDDTCSVVEVRPVEKTIFVVGNKGYVTRDEAEAEIKALCTAYILRS
jgi:hypothetical protein